MLSQRQKWYTLQDKVSNVDGNIQANRYLLRLVTTTILISNCTAKRNLLAVTGNVCITNAICFYVNNSRNILPIFQGIIERFFNVRQQ